MLTAAELRKVASLSGARDITKVEIDVILTFLLQLFHEKGILNHLAFKGGTMLRKMIFGPTGRQSTDLDFTLRTDIDLDELMLMMEYALEQPYYGLGFQIAREKDLYVTDDGCAANPVCAHAANERGVKIKIQVSTREKPILPVRDVAQLELLHFRMLPFAPVAIPSLAFEEALAEKIRAACQRSKVRDLYDLSVCAGMALNRPLVRSLAVLKLWNSGGPGLDYGTFQTRIEDGTEYDVEDLKNLLRKDQQPEIQTMIRRVVDGFRFLSDLTNEERALTQDAVLRLKDQAQALKVASQALTVAG